MTESVLVLDLVKTQTVDMVVLQALRTVSMTFYIEELHERWFDHSSNYLPSAIALGYPEMLYQFFSLTFIRGTAKAWNSLRYVCSLLHIIYISQSQREQGSSECTRSIVDLIHRFPSGKIQKKIGSITKNYNQFVLRVRGNVMQDGHRHVT